MAGFFSAKETQVENLRLKERHLSCYACKLYKGDIESPKMQPTGNFKKKILNIGDFTTARDDVKGKPFQNKSHYLYGIFEENGIDIEEDCLNVNAVMCHPYDPKTGAERLPTAKEIDCCRLNIMKIIKQHKPTLIFLFGKIALLSVIGSRWKGSLDGIEKWRGYIIPDQEFNCWIAPTFSPTFVQLVNRPEVDLAFKKDIGNALYQHKYTPFPVYKQPVIHYIKEPAELPALIQGDTISFDYETTGLKPHSKGHRIVCCSVAINEDEVYVFPMPKSGEKKQPWIDILKSKYIKKMAHNMKYEETWSLVKLKTRVKGWYWDSMQAAHILDNRTGTAGLKFQTYVTFGIIDYNSTVSKWLNAVEEKNANSKNRLEEYFETSAGKHETMTYCALDSIFQYRLAKLQMKLFELKTLPF